MVSHSLMRQPSVLGGTKSGLKFGLSNGSYWQFETKNTRGTIYQGSMICEEIKADYDIMRAGVQDGKHNRDFVSGNANTRGAYSGYRSHPAIGNSHNLGRGRRQDLP